MLEQLINIDKTISLYINSLHTPFFDEFMWLVSGKYTWLPFYLLILYMVYKKADNLKQFLFFLLFVAILITLTDQASVHLFKNVFKRLRPCHCNEIKNMIHLVNNHCGGKYGFISSHSTNAFGLFVFVSLFFKRKKLTIIFILSASLVAFSRVYLGVHYFGDIIAGAIVGTLIAFIVYFAFKRLILNSNK